MPWPWTAHIAAYFLQCAVARKPYKVKSCQGPCTCSSSNRCFEASTVAIRDRQQQKYPIMQVYALHAPLRCPRQQGQRQQQQQLHTPHQGERPPAQHRPLVAAPASPYATTDTVTQETFQEDEYESTQQGQRRKAWAAAVRSATGRKHHLVWEPNLDPPLLLGNVTVVLVGPKKPINCGTVARSCSCFEIDDLRIVQPRCQPNTRQASG